MFKWNKKGMIFSPDRYSEWMYSHAQCPFTYDFGDYIRIYFSTREAYIEGMSRAYGGWVDVDRKDMKKILNIADKPVLELGQIGEFDEFGSMPNSIVKVGDEFYLYFCGWTRAVSTPYCWEIGLAKGTDGKTFNKVGKGPIIGPTMEEPYLHACPQVYILDGVWHMFYLSGQRWIQGNEKIESQYLIVHATSGDGIKWNRNPNPIIESKVEYESQTSAAIIKMNNKFHMFFCYRYGLDFRKSDGRGYTLGYAYSEDLMNWKRDDSQVGISLSEDGWDSKMIAYPHIAQIDGKYYMFYCGNDFGKDGFGYAELEIV